MKMKTQTSVTLRGGDKKRAKKQKRSSNIELLRIVSMFLVLMIHYIPSREIPTLELLNENKFETLFNLELRSLSFVCVNCFVLISGFFGIRWKMQSLLNLLFQILFWIIISYFLVALYTRTFNLFEFLRLIFSDFTGRWFVQCYLGLYLIAPIVNLFIEKSSAKILGWFIIVFYAYSTIWGYVGKAEDFNEGMSVISLLGLYFVGAYLRRELIRLKKISALRWLSIYLLIGFIMVGISALSLKVGIESSPYGYLNPLIVLESVALFLFFANLNIGYVKCINYIAISAFSVYLFHMGGVIYPYYQEGCRYIESSYNYSFLWALLNMVVVFTVAVMIDKIRIVLFDYLKFIMNLFSTKKVRCRLINQLKE